MKFKDERVREEFTQAPLFLQVVCLEFERLSHLYGIDPTLTRVLEHICGDSGVHEARRACDFRDESPPGTFLYTQTEREDIVSHLNAKYARNDGKPTCLWHSFKNGPHHFHVQIAIDMTHYDKVTKEN